MLGALKDAGVCRSKHFEDLKELKDKIERKGTAPGKWITGGIASEIDLSYCIQN